ncbi:MAG: HAMP domain-containing histidine kinase [Oscillospiraceae bacterium]|jgi:signal transduction histidine kinase|nr:HAMP domain-containing histidine kinase [Oscillospiraceae bacterium]
MKNSIYFRIFIATALIVLFSISLLGGLSTALSYRRTMADKRDMMISTLHETARYVITQHLHYSVNLDDLNLRMWLSMTSRLTGFDLFVTNSDGKIESCSERGFTNLGKYVPEAILNSADIRDNKVIMSGLGHIYPERRQISAMPLAMNFNDETRIFGYLFVTSDVSAFRQEWRNFYSALIIIAVSVMFIAFIVSFLATKKQAEPLNEMANVARRFARGEFSARVKYQGRKDEIGQLTEAFNAMADTLESSEQLRRDFIESLSHEFKTPMTVISGFAEGLLDGTIPRDNEARYLGIISSETRRLSRLVRSMTEISTLQSDESSMLQNSSFDVSEIVRLALLSFDGKLENKKLSVDAVLPDYTIMTRGDADSITRVVYNLIDNAIKFSVPAGVIGLELWQQDSRVFVSVTNQGDAIPKEELPFIFDRFHKADKSRSADRDGVGLGLFIVKKILDNHNEDIFVTSSGGTTKFIFSLTVV